MKIGRWVLWGIIVCAVLAFLAAMGIVIYSVASRTMSNNYIAQVKLSLNAAALSDEGVWIKDGEKQERLVDESRRKLAFHLTQNASLPLFMDEDEEKAISLQIGQDSLVLVPVKGDGERAVVHFSTEGKSYRMVIRQYGLWDDLALCLGEDNRMSTK